MGPQRLVTFVISALEMFLLTYLLTYLLAWNELPADIRDITTTVTFKKHLKALLFNVAYGPAFLWHSYIVFYLAFYN